MIVRNLYAVIAATISWKKNRCIASQLAHCCVRGFLFSPVRTSFILSPVQWPISLRCSEVCSDLPHLTCCSPLVTAPSWRTIHPGSTIFCRLKSIFSYPLNSFFVKGTDNGIVGKADRHEVNVLLLINRWMGDDLCFLAAFRHSPDGTIFSHWTLVNRNKGVFGIPVQFRGQLSNERFFRTA